MIMASSRRLICVAVSSPKDARGEDILLVDFFLDRVTVLLFDFLGLRHGKAQAVSDIGCDVVAAHAQHHGVPDIAVDIDGHVGGPAADIAHHGAHLALGFGENHLRGGQRVEHELGHLYTGGLHALAQVLDRGSRGGDDMRFDFQAVAVHADRHADAVLPVDGETALDDVDDLAVMRDGHRLGGIQRAGNIILAR